MCKTFLKFTVAENCLLNLIHIVNNDICIKTVFINLITALTNPVLEMSINKKNLVYQTNLKPVKNKNTKTKEKHTRCVEKVLR